MCSQYTQARAANGTKCLQQNMVGFESPTHTTHSTIFIFIASHPRKGGPCLHTPHYVIPSLTSTAVTYSHLLVKIYHLMANLIAHLEVRI